MISTNSSQQKTLKKLNKMLDMADQTGSTSELVNINNATNVTTFDESSDNSILQTPYENETHSVTEIKTYSQIPKTTSSVPSSATGNSVFVTTLGKKMINVAKELPDVPSNSKNNTASAVSIQPPVRSRNRPLSMEASPIINDQRKSIGTISPPESPKKKSKIPLSPRKFNLQIEKNRTQSLEDVQTMLSEQLEELKSVVSGDNIETNKLQFFGLSSNPIEKQVTGTDSLLTDKYYSAINSPNRSHEEGLNRSNSSENRDAENVVVMKSSELSIKKINVSQFGDVQLPPIENFSDIVEAEDDDEYEDIEDDTVSGNYVSESTKTAQNKKSLKSRSNQSSSKKFDTNMMESLLADMDHVNDFENLGMKNEEKKYLQMLVKNLSKLTADMILDPSKYEEGLRRLKKAALALEGF
ncbi:hypothetical protein QEN19_004137 [Hanseniaspora menglaensis]